MTSDPRTWEVPELDTVLTPADRAEIDAVTEALRALVVFAAPIAARKDVLDRRFDELVFDGDDDDGHAFDVVMDLSGLSEVHGLADGLGWILGPGSSIEARGAEMIAANYGDACPELRAAIEAIAVRSRGR